MLSKYDTGANQRAYALSIVAGPLFRMTLSPAGTSSGNTNCDFTGLAPATGLWYHLVGQFTAGTGTIVATPASEGTLRTPQSYANSSVFASSAAFVLGMLLNSGAAAQQFDGIIDEVAIYNRVLNSTELNLLFNGGTPKPFSEYSASV